VFDVGLADDSQAAGRWDTSAGGEYFAAGVGGSITGRRADLAIIDDPVKSREDADSERSRERAWDLRLLVSQKSAMMRNGKQGKGKQGMKKDYNSVGNLNMEAKHMNLIKSLNKLDSKSILIYENKTPIESINSLLDEKNIKDIEN
jgi:hypothetical protein